MSEIVSGRPHPTVLLLAGEPSGDLHAAALAGALNARIPDVRMLGTGGDAMRAQDVELIAHVDDLAVMGFAEIVPKIPYFRRLERSVRSLMTRDRPDAVVLVDYPGFNMRIARAAHDLGLPVLYYIPPKVWAWKEGRARRLAETTDRVAAILPFEVDVLRRHGVDVTYVGNPLLDRTEAVASREEFLDAFGLPGDRPILAALPGSRAQELHRHLDVFASIAREVVSRRPDVLPVFSRAASMPAHRFHDIGFPVVTDTRALLRHASVALIKSGTATLEATLEDTPSVIGYRSSAVSMAIGRYVLKSEFFGLPNLIAGAEVVPEALQEEVTPELISPTLLALLDEDSAERAAQLEGLARIRERLGGPGASDRVAGIVMELMAEDAP